MPNVRAIFVTMVIGLVGDPGSASFAQSAVPQGNQDNRAIIIKGQKPEKKVCKTFDAPTGSRVGEQRICRTETEWKLAEAAAQRSMDRENQRVQADQVQTMNEQNRLARPMPH